MALKPAQAASLACTLQSILHHTGNFRKRKETNMKRVLLATTIFFSVVAGASAADYVVFVHGRSSDHCGTSTTDVNNYWGNSKNISTTRTKYFVGYDGASDPRAWGTCRAQTNLYTVLEATCTGANRCIVICHSAGCYATEYFIDKSSKVYNIQKVIASSSAAGGSELANAAFWTSTGMVEALKTANARGSYNHNNMKGISINMLAGYKGTFGASVILPGEDDGAVSYHSTCGINTTGSYSNCASGTKYSYHYIWSGATNNNNNWDSSKNGYYRTHVGDGSDSINDATRLEYNDCRTYGWGCS